ncbi:hypothetical protein BQ8482_420058 [Mesorhizobium delmotii]|uniref:Uncharacterized protein n=1 Tax=Mesorhizobium delmotii TaxID=1631247 RepID=A0A2P9ATC0_9HYPH|nr:hypothetical protein BQ8482_420058 [Mesorhizobium delmotii]
MGDEIPRPAYDLANTLSEIGLARALRATLAHQRARMIALLSDLPKPEWKPEMPPPSALICELPALPSRRR